MNLQNAIADLHRIAVVEGKPTSTARLQALAQLVVKELARRGLVRALTEASVAGGARCKAWDVSWNVDGKPRLVSLKILAPESSRNSAESN